MAFRFVQGGAGLSLVGFTHNDNELLTEALMEASNWSVIPQKNYCGVDASDEKFISPEIKALPEIKAIRSPSNLGYAKAKNLGLNQAKSRFIMCLHSSI